MMPDIMLDRSITIWFYYLSVSSLLSPPAYVQAESDFEVEASASVERNIGGYYSLNANLPDLPFGERGMVRLTIRNPFDADIAIGRSFSGCGCLKIELNDSVLKAKSDVVAELEIQTPSSHDSEEVNISFDIALDEKSIARGIHCSLNYKLSGLVAFRENLFIHEFPPGALETRFRIPLIVNPPTSYRKIRVTSKGNFSSKQEGRVTKDTVGNYFVELLVQSSNPMRNALNGEVVVDVPGTTIRDSIICTLLAEQSIRIAPSTLRFQQSSDGRFVVDAIIRIKRKSETSQEANGLASNRVPRANSKIANSSFRITHEIQTLSSEVYRVRFIVDLGDAPKDALPREQVTVNTVFRIDGEVFRLNSPANFKSFNHDEENS